MPDAQTPINLNLPQGCAVVIGASGGVGRALLAGVETSGIDGRAIGLSRHSSPAIDLTSEASIEACARHVAAQGAPLRLLVIATGILHDETMKPERSLRDLSPEQLARAFAINTIGPALVLKHFTPLLAREGRSVIAALSAKVGSIGDNELGGWYGYRASKAALNQIIRTTSIELKRSRRDAICVALHPGTVDTPLSAPFSKAGLNTRPPDVAAHDLLTVIAQLSPQDTGCFLDYKARTLSW
jgi:NAD(P)-dependent dehydrogenase (short-subunit alcohol dehydrogenase family)